MVLASRRLSSTAAVQPVGELSQLQLANLVEIAKDYAQCNGISMRPKNHDNHSDVVEFAPITLLPTVFPRDLFLEALQIQKDLQLLYHNIGNDFDFLKRSLAGVIQTDDFTKRLFDIMEKVRDENSGQPVSLSIVRADYMVNEIAPSLDGLPSHEQQHPQEAAKSEVANPSPAKRSKRKTLDDVSAVPVRELKQVEVNCIAASFASLDTKVNHMHRMLLQRLGYTEAQLRHTLPENHALRTLAEGLFAAWTEYGDANAVLLFVVEARTRNICDQRALEFEVLRQSAGVVPVMRMSMAEIDRDCRWDEASRAYFVPEEGVTANDSHDGAAGEASTRDEDSADEAKSSAKASSGGKIRWGRSIAVVYFRAGYVPADYAGETEWRVRERLERSRAIKCPSIGVHLAGTKKVQQVLTRAGVVEQFVKARKTCERLRATFMPMYGFDDEAEATEALALVRADAKAPAACANGVGGGKFVLKPQLEGGGNNIYGADVHEALERLTPEERSAYVLMERIHPPSTRAHLLRAGTPVVCVETISELGVFGWLLGTKTGAIRANVGGELPGGGGAFLLRTKAAGVDEGGVMAGASALDSPFLIV